jgi:hypothetical protein
MNENSTVATNPALARTNSKSVAFTQRKTAALERTIAINAIQTLARRGAAIVPMLSIAAGWL